ncbi:MAG: O-antigen ligase family protein [Mycolicibacterium cosmeticum]|nr:O-antigen ligase family protein [Mycolicibacterium cosmeticum]
MSTRELRALQVPTWLDRVGLSALVLSTFTATWGGIAGPFGSVADGLLLLSLLVCGTRFACGTVRVQPPVWLWIPAVAILMCLTVQLFVGEQRYSAALRYESFIVMSAKNETRGAYWLIALLLVPIAIITFTALDSRTPRFVLGAYLGGTCASAAVAVSDLAGITNISGSLGLTAAGGRQFGLTNHPNTLGLTCAMTVPLAIYFLHTERRKWLLRVAIVLLFGGALASGSRGAQVAAPLAAVATVMFLPNRRASLRQLGAIAAVGMIAAAAIATIVAPDKLTELVRFGSDDFQGAGKSNTVRALVLNQAIADFLRFPLFGLGLRHIVEAHNIYVQLLASGGVILLVSMIWYWGGAVVDGWKLYRSGESLAIPLMVSTGTWLVLGIVENQVTDRYLYYGIGCVAALVATRQQQLRPRPRSRRSAAIVKAPVQ